MNASNLNRHIRFLRAEWVPDGYGGSTSTHEPFGLIVAASRRDISDAEKVSAGRLQSEVAARFRVRSTPFTRSITADDRLSCDGKTFEITGIKEVDGLRGFLEISAVSGIW